MTTEVLEFLLHERSRLIVDATVGIAGHATAILSARPDIQLVGIDRDPNALQQAKLILKNFSNRVRLVNANYSDMDRVLLPDERADGVFADLGLSSLQLDTGPRGFSYATDGPLDMRMSQDGLTARELLETTDADDLAQLLREYGEVDGPRRIANKIHAAVAGGEMNTTGDLRKAIDSALRGTAPPALLSKVFQAIRIAVNDELGGLKRFLVGLVGRLNRHAAIVVISYHSLEDRLVKEFFRRESRDCICPPQAPVCACDHHATLQVLTRRVVKPSRQEIASNPRARSAKLRAARVVS